MNKYQILNLFAYPGFADALNDGYYPTKVHKVARQDSYNCLCQKQEVEFILLKYWSDF